MARTELADFLRTRRAAMRPDGPAATLVGGGRRRTPGLRREEVAERAHMSVDYYTRLEQARGPRPSARILDSLATALHLAPVERSHLFRLAGVLPQAPAGPTRTVQPYVLGLLGRLPYTAAFVTAADYGVLAWNPLADALFGGIGTGTNFARRRFLDRDDTLIRGHEEFGAYAVARLRAAADRYPGDAGLATLIAELTAGSAEFRGLWADNPVRAPGHRTKTITHSELGRLQVNCDVLTIPEDDQQVVFITADPDTASDGALRRLAAGAGSPTGITGPLSALN